MTLKQKSLMKMEPFITESLLKVSLGFYFIPQVIAHLRFEISCFEFRFEELICALYLTNSNIENQNFERF